MSATLHVSTHPLVQHKLLVLRDKTTTHRDFRELVREITVLLAYEATQDLAMHPAQAETPLTTAHGHKTRETIGLVPVLRAGLGMVEGVQALLPNVQVWHLGLYRDERTLMPVEYYNRLPDEATVGLCLLLDPMLATGGSATAAVDVLKRWGVPRIKFVGLIAAPEGVAKLHGHHPDVPIHVGAVDERLNARGYIVPGLGDAGDRMFGT